MGFYIRGVLDEAKDKKENPTKDAWVKERNNIIKTAVCWVLAFSIFIGLIVCAVIFFKVVVIIIAILFGLFVVGGAIGACMDPG